MGSPTAEAHHATEAAVRLACDRCRVTLSGDDVRPALAAMWAARHQLCTDTTSTEERP